METLVDDTPSPHIDEDYIDDPVCRTIIPASDSDDSVPETTGPTRRLKLQHATRKKSKFAAAPYVRGRAATRVIKLAKL